MLFNNTETYSKTIYPGDNLADNKKPRNAVVKVTDLCNLNCKYCYEGKICPKYGMMNNETLENVITKTLDSSNRVKFIWHGGESLLNGIEFFEQIIDIEKEQRTNQQIQNSIQTNGTLLDDKYLDFFKKEKIHVGLSIDGPREVHDAARVYPNGKGTFDNVMASVQKMKERNMHIGVVSVLSKKCLGKIKEVYDFFKDEGINRIHMNPMILGGRAEKYADELSLSSEECGKALIELFDLWFYDKSYSHIEPLTTFVGSIVTKEPQYHVYTPSCQERFFVVNPNGDIYPCTRFNGTEFKQFKLGNINKDDVETVFNSEFRKTLISRPDRIEECKPCEYNDICRGGCMHSAFAAYGDAMEKDGLCESYKILFKHIYPAIKKELGGDMNA